ncbi:MAG: phage regulatory protein/antirepressor Ant [Rhizobiales bacterium]|nr:phage regulatory protein/antirepressor Ant [Hyphomicrobiales bacterium]
MTEGIDATRSPIVRLTETNEAMADSRDVAAYFGKRHTEVLRAIQNLGCSPDFKERNFASFKINDLTGESTSHVEMTKDGFTFLAMGFTGGRAATFKERYIAAFNVMETELRNRRLFDPAVALNDPAWLRNALGHYTEKVIALETANKEMAVDVAAFDRIAKADGSLNVTESAKALQMRPKDLFSYLSSHGWIYRRAGAEHWLGYQSRVQTGDLEHKVTTVLRADGSEKVTEQVRVTAQGLAKLAKLFPSAVAAA